MKTAKPHLFNVHMEPLDDGRFAVTVPKLGCATVGNDYEHGLQMARECIECHLEGLLKVGLPLPEEMKVRPFDTVVEVDLSEES